MKLSPVTRLYIRNAIITSIVFAVLTMLFDFYRGKEFRLVSLLVSSSLFGLIFGLFNTFVQSEPIGSIARRPLSKEDLKLTQRRSMHLRLSPQEVLTVLNEAGIFKKRKARFLNQSIIVDTSMSWASWGEHITITWSEDGDGYAYEIESRPNNKLASMDGGKNFANAENIVAALSGKKVFFAA